MKNNSEMKKLEPPKNVDEAIDRAFSRLMEMDRDTFLAKMDEHKNGEFANLLAKAGIGSQDALNCSRTPRRG